MASLRSPAALVGAMCGVEVLSMQGFGSYAALLPELRAQWGLSYAWAGWVEGAFQAGYLIAVPLLVTLTDRVDARRIFAVAAVIGGLASLGFALFAQGLWSACLLRALAGVGLAGTFMPGLRLLSDRIEGAGQSRAVAFYTASFSVGASVSVLLTGLLAERYGWRVAFGAAAGGGMLAAVIAASMPPRPTAARAPSGGLLDLRPALRNPDALSYNLAYACHMWELYGFRAWLVAFLTFCAARSPTTPGGLTPAVLAAAILMLGLPASVLGNELALRRGRRRVIAAIMLISALTSLFIGASALLPMAATLLACAFYSMTITGESASLTAGAVAAAPGHRGATMTVHTLAGFAAATFGPLAFGAALDVVGADRWLGWAVGFALLGAGPALGPILIKRIARSTAA